MKVKLIPDTSELEKTAKKTTIGMSGKGDGANTGLLGALASPLSSIAVGIGGLVAMLAGASDMLKSVLGGILKTLMLILKPIGDILAIALMPLLHIMRPIGLFFNTLMRPYIQRAMMAMRSGGALMAQGDIEGAMGAFGLGAQYLLKPIFDGMLKGTSLMLTTLTDIFASVFDSAGMSKTADAMRSAGERVEGTVDSLIEKGFIVLDSKLMDLAVKTDKATGSSGELTRAVYDLGSDMYGTETATELLTDALNKAAPKIEGLLPDLTTIDTAEERIKKFYDVLFSIPSTLEGTGFNLRDTPLPGFETISINKDELNETLAQIGKLPARKTVDIEVNVKENIVGKFTKFFMPGMRYA